MGAFLILGLLAVADEETSVTGTVFTQFRERAKPVPGLKNDPACDCLHAEPPKVDDLLLSPNGGVKNALVRVTKGLPEKEHPVPQEPVVLDQVGCVYVPRVIAVRAGQPVEFRSQDDMLHNVHGLPFDNKEFNRGIHKGQSFQLTFARPEVFKVKCDVHNWMAAYVGVVEHPYFALSDAEGRFTIKNLPPGKYTLEVWHERLKGEPLEIKVEGKETKLAPIELVVKR